MSALQTLIAAADGTTDEDAHVFVPVKAIRELADELPAHVKQASMDADIRALAIEQAVHTIEWHCTGVTQYTYDTQTFNTDNEWLWDDPVVLVGKIAQAVRVLDHFGLIASRAGSLVCIRKEAVHG